ncbi:putative sugar nucleotidyl transferase [Thermogutta sp.]|uniref:putative sugar nucleotidyl transferase n=1 Tax=Thermogutta sp. TaxID=1962930 RepID=UPI003C7D453A
MNILLFEDELVTQLYPITTGRPAFAISCGGYRLIDLIRRFEATTYADVRPHLTELTQLDFALTFPPEMWEGRWLFVNARLVPSVGAMAILKELVEDQRNVLVRWNNHTAAASITFPTPIQRPRGSMSEFLVRQCAEDHVEVLDRRLVLIEYPHEVVKYHMEILGENLADRIARGNYRQLSDGLFVGDNVVLGDYLSVDSSAGPVVIESGARVGPFCHFQGPVLVGQNAKLIEQASLKDNVALGHTTKVGGEVEASIVEPYSNKQHHGFLGHSYLGSWVNLGAGTCNSDLKNTYGLVVMEYNGKRVPTGMQFMGCIIGDYTKTAVNTGIFTGKVIGVCCMVYGFVTTNVPSFTNYARLFGQMTELPVEVAIAGQQRMFLRRNVIQRPCDIQLIRDMYELTQGERRLANAPLVL